MQPQLQHTPEAARKLSLEMLSTKMTLHAAAPAPHKRKVQRAADGRAGERNQTSSPLFRRLGANFRGEAFRDARDEFLENLFLGQILAVIDARGRRGPPSTFQSFGRGRELQNP